MKSALRLKHWLLITSFAVGIVASGSGATSWLKRQGDDVTVSLHSKDLGCGAGERRKRFFVDAVLRVRGGGNLVSRLRGEGRQRVRAER